MWLISGVSAVKIQKPKSTASSGVKSGGREVTPKAYSYLRFSTADQIRGDSYRRQTELARAWCEKTGVPLVDNYRDLGVSAFRGANADKGALKAFLDRVESGVIEPGSYLIVESLDRLSRTDITFALQMFLGLINAGIVVVTLADQRVYDRERINDGNFTDIIISLTILSRANEESRMKSSRLSAAWADKRTRLGEEKMTAVCPAWLHLNADRKGFEVIPEKAAIVRRIYEMAAQGKGKATIARTFNREQVPRLGDSVHWHISTVDKVLCSRAVIGEFRPGRTRNGKKEMLDPVLGYFPAVVSMELFAAVQRIRRTRPSYRGRGEKNPLSGLAYNAITGNKMMRITKGPEAKWVYLVDNAAPAGAAPYVSWKFEEFMPALLTVCEAATTAPPAPKNQNVELQNCLSRMDAIETQIPRLVEFISTGFSASVEQKLRELEKEKGDLEKRISELRLEEKASDIDLGKIDWRDTERLKENLRAALRRIDVNPVERWFKVTTFDGREIMYREDGEEIEIVSSESPAVLAVPEKARPRAQATRLKSSKRSAR
jgi:DNA invertase Pin-like site-specific DNA recombinase